VTPVPVVDADRLVGLFVELTALPSPSGREAKVAAAVRTRLEALGLEVSEDDAATHVGGECGNLSCVVPGTGTHPALTLAAHLDTVEPQGDIVPIIEGGIIRNSAGTILGADNKAAVTALVGVTEALIDQGLDFPTFELILSVAEERSVLGSRFLPPGLPSAPMAVVFDSSGPIGGMVTRAPTQQTIVADFKGSAAHAGLEPEKGRNAIQAAAYAVSQMQLGRLDDVTTANVGVIEGGVAQNIVPASCRIRAECRSLDDVRLAEVSAALVDAIHLGAARAECDVQVDVVTEYRSFRLTDTAPVVELARAAVRSLDLHPEAHASGGGSDANVFNARGVPTVNLDCGMMRVHAPEEHIAVTDLVNLARLAAAMITLTPPVVRSE
jgi:tripeptide aminopeptidase